MSFSRRALDDAKIRVSWGITGNEQIGNYDYLYSYATGDIYDGVGGVYPARLAVDNLRWEETRQVDVGLDLSFFNSRLTITADYYDKYTDGLLANRRAPEGVRILDHAHERRRGQQPRFRVLDRRRPRPHEGFPLERLVQHLAQLEHRRETRRGRTLSGKRPLVDGRRRFDRRFLRLQAEQHLRLRRIERLHARHVAAAHAGLRKRLVQPLHARRAGLQRQLRAEETAQRQALPRRRRQLGGGRRFARRRDRRERPHDHRQRTADLYRRPEHELHLQEFRSLRVVLLLVRRTDLQLRRTPSATCSNTPRRPLRPT